MLLKVSPSYCYENSMYDELKESASYYFKKIPPATRMELVSRYLGFKSNAALRSIEKPVHWCSVFYDEGKAFSQNKGFDIDPLNIHLIMSRTMAKFAIRISEHRELNSIGLTANVDRYEFRHLPVTEMVHAREAARQRKIVDGKEDLISSSEGFLRAYLLCSLVKQIQRRNRKISSYGIKHLAEKCDFHIDERISFPKGYVSNGALIAAAIARGFVAYPNSYDNPNAHFNMSMKYFSFLGELQRQVA